MTNNRIKKKEPEPIKQVEVVAGNTQVLIVQLLSEISKTLREIRDARHK